MHRGLMLLAMAAHLLCAQIHGALAGGGFDAPFVPEQAGSGCGWDYACPPRPDFGRPAITRSQVNIKNNYGIVKIYPGRGRYPLGRSFPHGCPGPSCPGGVAGGIAEGGIVEGGTVEGGIVEGGIDESSLGQGGFGDGHIGGGVSCGGYPCTQDCGISCWIARFKAGYCGHGCDYYAEHVRFVAAQTVVTVPRPIYYRDYYRDPAFGNFQGGGGAPFFKPGGGDWRGGYGPGPYSGGYGPRPYQGGYAERRPYAKPKPVPAPPVEDYNSRYDPPYAPKCGGRSDC